MISTSFDSLRFRTRWFCYLDLLGFTNKVKSESVDDLIPLYQKIARRLRRKAGPKKSAGIIHSWFSDTFIIYSKDDSNEEFAALENICRTFFQELIILGIPLRGAITHGKLYSKSSQNVFVGPALIDAYLYGERQDWIGFILTPSVNSRLHGTELALENRPHYRLVTETEVLRHEPSTPVYAFAFNNGTVNGKNPYKEAIERLKDAAPVKDKGKYDRALAFIDKHAPEN